MNLANRVLNMFRMKFYKRMDLLTTDDGKQIFRPSTCKHSKTARDCQSNVLFCTDCGLICMGSHLGKTIWSNKMSPFSTLSQGDKEE